MALIKCRECGHEVSDKASACPKCGCPITKGSKPHIHQETPQVQPSYYDDKNGGSSRKWLWLYGIIALLVALIVVALIVGGGYYFFNKTNGTEREEVNEIRIDSLLADGHYTFKGNWESSRYSAQPCKLEFEKNGMNLESCAYTNLKYDTRIPLTGTIQNDTLHFVGDISGKQLVINLKIASDGDMLIGEGIDYAHSGDRAKLNLSKSTNDNGSNKNTEETGLEDSYMEHKTVSEESFTTSKGTFYIERTVQMWYDKGVEHGTSDKHLPYPRKYFNGDGTEDRFKVLWVAWFGVPDNDITKEIYNNSLERYKQGYEVGWNF